MGTLCSKFLVIGLSVIVPSAKYWPRAISHALPSRLQRHHPPFYDTRLQSGPADSNQKLGPTARSAPDPRH